MPDLDLPRLTQFALEAARGAAVHALTGYRTHPSIARKAGYADIVTRFDVESEQRIRAALGATTPQIPIVGEEQGGTPDERPTWFVDPIDGTMNFAHGHPFFAVSIGLLERGKPLAGAVVAPALQLEWWGHLGGGSFRNGQPCRVSATSELSDGLIATGFSPLMHGEGAPEDNMDALRRVTPRARGIRRCGSAALDLCLVADGTYEAYWERKLSAWDSAAGAALVLAAGGRISDLLGGAFDLTRGYFLASNGGVHDALLSLLKQDGAPPAS
jgi:myo-inositol-1(or 4)-monophosphatase